ncbi:MAG: dihydroorotate dehydrogenase-like protein [Polyangiaceae bacterium]|nr:dihydroorotate dehydrogenase-like protein [Polyangiaceae bacterium]
MDLATSYLGLELKGPLIVGASPIGDRQEVAQRAVDAGAAAIVLRSLFEEQLTAEAQHLRRASDDFHFAEAKSVLPEPADAVFGPDQYLAHIARLKRATGVPIIASLNGTTASGWLRYAVECQQAGADALELNVYQLGSDPERTAENIEAEVLQMVLQVKASITIPVTVKLSPFFTSLGNLLVRLEEAGANGFVLFNRLYQPDIDAEELEVSHQLELSTSAELPLRLRWLALLSPRLSGSLACSGGVHTGLDAVKALMAGAHVVQVVSAVLRHGPSRFGDLLAELRSFLERHEYPSLAALRGSMSVSRCPDPRAFERQGYQRVLASYRDPIAPA